VGVCVGMLLGIGLVWDSIPAYITQVLPVVMKHRNSVSIANHALIPHFPNEEWKAYPILAVLLFSWMAAAYKRIRGDQDIVFAGTLAISTYFSGISEDYNLVTIFPLLWCLCSRALTEGKSRREYKTFFFLGILFVFGHRQVFRSMLVYFQIVWLIGIALWLQKDSVVFILRSASRRLPYPCHRKTFF
jgi:hypothetical protein